MDNSGQETKLNHDLLSGASQELVAGTLAAIRNWKEEQPSVVSRALGTVLSPVTWLISQLVPLSAIEGVIGGMDWAANNIVTSRGKGNVDDLMDCDARADATINFHVALAIVQGSAAGVFGAIALPVDIPTLILMALRLIRQIGIEYGFEEDTDDARQFILAILSASGANSQKEKVQALVLATILMNKLAKETWKSMAVKAASNKISTDSAIIAVKSLARSLGFNLTKRKALAAIPAIGAVVGGSANGWYMREVGIAAQRSFQERWLLDRSLMPENKTDTSAGTEASGGLL